MKKLILIWVIIASTLIFTACKSPQDSESGTVYIPQASSSDNGTETDQNEVIPESVAAYPVDNQVDSQPESAYPVSSEDLQLLVRSWYMHSYRENGIEQTHSPKTIRFFGDVYEIIIDESTVTGTWSARIQSLNPILVLNSNDDSTLFYEIIQLDETSLQLRTVQNQTTIEEDYLPVD